MINRRYSILLLTLGSVVHFTCSSDSVPPGETLNPVVSGLVWDGSPIPDTPVIIEDSAGEIARIRTDSDGRFEIPIGIASGQLTIRARHLRQRVTARAGEDITDVLLSPIGTLAEAYADAPGIEREEALSVVSSFFSVPLSGTRITPPIGEEDLDTRDEPVEARIAGLVQSGIRFLAEEMIRESGIQSDPTQLLALLERDIAFDGLFNGIGPNGESLFFAGIPVDALTLRSSYISGLRSFLQSERNRSGLSESFMQVYFDEVLFSRSVLFPASTWLDPDFTEDVFQVRIEKSGALQGEGTVLSGEFDIVASFMDGDLLTNIEVTIARTSTSGGIVDETLVGQRASIAGSTEERFAVSSSDFGDGQVVVSVKGEVRSARRATLNQTFVIDNTAPALSSTTPSPIASSNTYVSASLVDATSGARELSVSVNGVERVRVNTLNGQQQNINIDVPCTDGVMVNVVGFDAAGNTAQSNHVVDCDDTPPPVALEFPVYFPENSSTYQVTVNHNPQNANRPIYVYTSIRSELAALSQDSRSVVEKFWNRLFVDSENRVEVVITTPADHVQFSYQLGVRSPATFRDARRIGADRYIVGLNYEDIPDLVQSDGENSQLIIRAIGANGNFRELTVPFRLKVQYPPVVIDRCFVSPVPYDQIASDFTPGGQQRVIGNARLYLPTYAAPPEGIEDTIVGFTISPLRRTITTGTWFLDTATRAGCTQQQTNTILDRCNGSFTGAVTSCSDINCIPDPFLPEATGELSANAQDATVRVRELGIGQTLPYGIPVELDISAPSSVLPDGATLSPIHNSSAYSVLGTRRSQREYLGVRQRYTTGQTPIAVVVAEYLDTIRFARDWIVELGRPSAVASTDISGIPVEVQNHCNSTIQWQSPEWIIR